MTCLLLLPSSISSMPLIGQTLLEIIGQGILRNIVCRSLGLTMIQYRMWKKGIELRQIINVGMLNNYILVNAIIRVMPISLGSLQFPWVRNVSALFTNIFRTRFTVSGP